MTDSLEDDLRALDQAVARAGLDIWIGAEPTFTLPQAQDPAWLNEAEGDDKENRARALLLDLAPRLSPCAQVCRAVGRQFPEEPRPRFAYGARWPRAGDRGSSPDADHPLDGPPVPPPAPHPDEAWMTVTPDPGVVEVNLPPAPDLVTFARYCRACYRAAEAVGLSPVRRRWNGDETDSGGGGQVTLGGPTPAASPFFRRPALLPGLLRFVNRHPSLSYWFAPECVGSASQGPRPDEGTRERFAELQVALAQLAAEPAETPDDLWQALAPLLVDGSGNSHRAEVNVEKLWNPYLEARGRLGLVELRALRMEPTPERMIAVAALWRTLALRLAERSYEEPLRDWGERLHDRFGLPYLLAADLAEVLGDLRDAGFPLGTRLESLLLARPAPPLVTLARGDADLTVSRAREFWPLVGDVASQERRGARVVDSSNARVEIEVRSPHGPPGRVLACGRDVPLTEVAPGHFLAGVRYRSFVPRPGFHPRLAPHDPLVLTWHHRDQAVTAALHGWIPGGGVYPGLPDEAEAARRRAERVVVSPPELSAAVSARAASPLDAGPPDGPLTVDLRHPWT
jgi:uncharacterized protein (DUF2126 family)